MSGRSRIAEALWPRDARHTTEIEAGIREELESHIEQMVAEQIRAGLPEDEARRAAVAKFGDVDRYAAECRRIDLGDRLIVRRGLVLACAALLVTCIFLGWRVWQSEQTAARLRQELARTVGQTPAAKDATDEWVKRLATLRDHMHTAFAVGPELTLLDPDEGLAIVREAWPKFEIAEVKTGLLKAFAFSKALKPNLHPRLLQVLDLGMHDADSEIRSYAASYLEEYAGENVSDDPQRYATWYREHGDASPESLLTDSNGPSDVLAPRVSTNE